MDGQEAMAAMAAGFGVGYTVVCLIIGIVCIVGMWKVFTKADKLTPNKARQAVEAYKKKLLETWEELPPMFVTSSEKKDGRDDVLNYIEQINNELKG